MKKRNSCVYYMAKKADGLAQKYLPDTFVLAFLLAMIVFVCGILFAQQTPMQMIQHFCGSMRSLLGFSMKSISMVVFSMVCMGTKPIKKLMRALTRLPKTPTQAILMGCVMELIFFPLNSTFALVFGAVYAREIGKQMRNVDYPLLVAVCYCGYCTWQGGMTGVTPLQVATAGSFSEKILGRTIPLTETVFTPFNAAILLTLILTIPLIVYLMIPRRKEDVCAAAEGLLQDDEDEVVEQCPEQATWALRLEYSRIPTLILGVMLMLYAGSEFVKKGIDFLDVNMLNVLLLGVGLCFVRSIRHFVALVKGALVSTAGILIQFPIYAGIMGMVMNSGIGASISNAIVQHASASTMPNICHIASAILNMFIPSGGGQWAIEAPIYLPVAQALGADTGKVVMACAYGDALTNLMQPFWALPLLGITRLSMRDIMGYCTLICVWGLICTQAVMFVFSVI